MSLTFKHEQSFRCDNPGCKWAWSIVYNGNPVFQSTCPKCGSRDIRLAIPQRLEAVSAAGFLK